MHENSTEFSAQKIKDFHVLRNANMSSISDITTIFLYFFTDGI